MARIDNLTNFLEDIATSIREKKGTEGTILAENFDKEILSIETGSGGDTSDATATDDDVLSPKTFYADNRKQTGNIQVKSTTISSGIKVQTEINDNNKWIASVNDKYGIAVVYVYNQQNPWWIYKWENGNISYVLQTLNAGAYPNGTLLKSVAISRELNEQGYLNIWCHAVNSSTWSDDMRGFLGVLQYDVDNNQIIANKTINTYKPGGYSRDWNEDGNMAPDPNNPNRCAVTINNNNQHYTSLLVYRPVENTLLQYVNNFNESPGCYSTEWNDDSSYILVCKGGKTHPTSNSIYAIGNNTITRKIIYDNTKPSTIYKHYIIEGNKIYDISTGSKVLIKEWTSYADLASGRGFLWTYLNYLFVVSYTTSELFVFSINTDLSITPLTVRTAYLYISSSNSQYEGTLLLPMSNSFLFYSPLQTMIHCFTLISSSEVLTEAVIKGETFVNIEQLQDVNVNAEDVLFGKTFYNSSGKKTDGSMPNNGQLNYTPSIEQQTIPLGYTSGGKISPVTADIDINIISENIRKGISILDVEGTFEGSTGGDATSDGNLQAKYLLEGYSAVVDGKLIEGTMKDYNTRTIIATSEDVTIPEGHYDSLLIPIVNASNCIDYTECKEAILSI